jgi:hypothetical protein
MMYEINIYLAKPKLMHLILIVSPIIAMSVLITLFAVQLLPKEKKVTESFSRNEA